MKRLHIAIVLVFLIAFAAAAQSGVQGNQRDNTPANYRLTITSNVRGADIYIDGIRQRGTAPADFQLRAGTYLIRVEARGYLSWEGRIQLNSNQSVQAYLTPPTASVTIRIPQDLLNDMVRDPWRMIDVYVDNRLQRDTRFELEPGTHTVAIVSGGLKLERSLYFQAGRSYTLDLFLQLNLN